MYESASETNQQNRSIPRLLETYGRIYCDPVEAIDLYTTLGTFAPPLDGAGNSVRGQLAAAFLARGLGLDLFISEPEA